jgi:hypothetical protein
MKAPDGIDADLLNEAMEGFQTAVGKEPMLSHVTQFMRAEFDAKGIKIADVNKKHMDLYLDGFSTGFCYIAMMLKTGVMRMECFEK